MKVKSRAALSARRTAATAGGTAPRSSTPRRGPAGARAPVSVVNTDSPRFMFRFSSAFHAFPTSLRKDTFRVVLVIDANIKDSIVAYDFLRNRKNASVNSWPDKSCWAFQRPRPGGRLSIPEMCRTFFCKSLCWQIFTYCSFLSRVFAIALQKAWSVNQKVTYVNYCW